MSVNPEAPQFVVIGGGTGNFTVLSGLRPHIGEGLTAVVGMADDGGSTGVLRDERGVLPPGDVRQCLVALSNSPQETRDFFNHRLSKGKTENSGLAGHTIGNIMIAGAQEMMDGDINAALDMVGRVFDIKGRVIPATVDDRRLRLTTVDGEVIEGEHVAEESSIPSLRGAKVGFDVEPTKINERAEAAIKEADLVVIAPGDLYTSIAPALAVRGMREALKASQGVVQVANLMNRERHTAGFSVSTHASEIERIVGEPVLGHVIYNTEEPDKETLARYAGQGEYLVEADLDELARATYHAIGKPLLSHAEVKLDPNDAIAATRSLIRHDPQKVAHALLGVYYGEIV